MLMSLWEQVVPKKSTKFKDLVKHGLKYDIANFHMTSRPPLPSRCAVLPLAVLTICVLPSIPGKPLSALIANNLVQQLALSSTPGQTPLAQSCRTRTWILGTWPHSCGHTHQSDHMVFCMQAPNSCSAFLLRGEANLSQGRPPCI